MIEWINVKDKMPECTPKFSYTPEILLAVSCGDRMRYIIAMGCYSITNGWFIYDTHAEQEAYQHRVHFWAPINFPEWPTLEQER